VGLLLRLPHGGPALLDGVAGLAVAVLLALPPFALGFLGGGDVKLLGAVGAFLGLGRLPGALAFVALTGGGLALLEAARQHALKRALANTYGFARDWMLFARAGVAARWQQPGTMSVPYGIAIAIGTLAWWFLEGRGL
jgi:prepilin peptidase CpaA